jgi:hypothetical protein
MELKLGALMSITLRCASWHNPQYWTKPVPTAFRAAPGCLSSIWPVATAGVMGLPLFETANRLKHFDFPLSERPARLRRTPPRAALPG